MKNILTQGPQGVSYLFLFFGSKPEESKRLPNAQELLKGPICFVQCAAMKHSFSHETLSSGQTF